MVIFCSDFFFVRKNKFAVAEKQDMQFAIFMLALRA